jgi:phage tail tape-measure protein
MSGALSGAATGAAIGAAAGGIGAIPGAAVGFVAGGLIGGFIGGNAENNQRKAEEKARKEAEKARVRMVMQSIGAQRQAENMARVASMNPASQGDSNQLSIGMVPQMPFAAPSSGGSYSGMAGTF